MDAVPSIQASTPKGALEDLTSCLYYSDNWDSTTAIHQLKHGWLEDLEDGYNKVCRETGASLHTLSVLLKVL